jgi:indole-3-glycerol phosphate synthase
MSATRSTIPSGVVTPGGVLDRIIAAKADRLAQAKITLPAGDLMSKFRDRPQRASRAFESALRRRGKINIIAEIKRRSPSRGDIRPDLDPAATARLYERGGAAALSVLAEEDFFGGSLDDIRIAREVVDLPLLRKDFIFDQYQVYESAFAGADALLLIVAMLEDELLVELIGLCDEIGIDALVEVHSKEEMERCCRSGARIIGVNNRDLRTFEVNLGTSTDLARQASADSVLVAESGISTPDEIVSLRSVGYTGFLVGEHLMKAGDPAEALQRLLSAI